MFQVSMWIAIQFRRLDACIGQTKTFLDYWGSLKLCFHNAELKCAAFMNESTWLGIESIEQTSQLKVQFLKNSHHPDAA